MVFWDVGLDIDRRLLRYAHQGPRAAGDAWVEYDVRTVVFLACSLIAMRTKNARFHAAFAMIGTVYILSVIFRQYFLVL